MIQNEISCYNVVFNEKSVQEVTLKDGFLYISYLTLAGNLEEFVCPDLNDAEYFLMNTVKNYIQDTLAPELLQVFVAELQNLKQRITNYKNGYSKEVKQQYDRFLIRECIENVFRLKASQEVANVSNICDVHIDLDHDRVCISYKKHGLNTTIDSLILDGSVSYDGIYNFVRSCLPKINGKEMTFRDADIVAKELYDVHLCKINTPELL